MASIDAYRFAPSLMRGFPNATRRFARPVVGMTIPFAGAVARLSQGPQMIAPMAMSPTSRLAGNALNPSRAPSPPLGDERLLLA